MENDFQKVIRHIRNHWEALACALAFSVLLAVPFVSQRIALGPEFQGIEPEFTNDEALYLSCIQDVLDGHPLSGNSYLAEHKDKPPQQLFATEFMSAQLIRLTGLSVAKSRIGIGVLLGFVTFLVAYAVAYRMIRSRMAALIATVVILFGWYGATMIRPISPQFVFVFWWLMLGALWHMNEGYASRKHMLWAGGMLGILFYIYPYYWTWAMIFMALMAVGLWLTDRSHAYRWLGALVIGSGIGSGPIILSLKASGLSEYSETMTRLGMITTRFPSGLEVLTVSGLGLLACAWFLYRRTVSWDRSMLFWVAGLATSIIAVNQHVITGKNFEFSSHYDTQAVCIAVLFAFFLLKYFPWRRLVYAGALILALVSAWNSFSPLAAVSEVTAYRQDYAPVFAWLKHNAPLDAVVYANDDVSYWIPVYTSQNVFSSRNAGFFFVSDAELERLFLGQHYFNMVDRDLILDQERALVGVRYVDQRGHVRQQNKLRGLLGLDPLPEPVMPEADIERIIREAKAMKVKSFEQVLRPHQVDYVVWDAMKDPHWKLSAQTWLTPVFQHRQFVVFARTSQLAAQ